MWVILWLFVNSSPKKLSLPKGDIWIIMSGVHYNKREIMSFNDWESGLNVKWPLDTNRSKVILVESYFYGIKNNPKNNSRIVLQTGLWSWCTEPRSLSRPSEPAAQYHRSRAYLEWPGVTRIAARSRETRTRPEGAPIFKKPDVWKVSWSGRVKFNDALIGMQVG